MESSSTKKIMLSFLHFIFSSGECFWSWTIIVMSQPPTIPYCLQRSSLHPKVGGVKEEEKEEEEEKMNKIAYSTRTHAPSPLPMAFYVPKRNTSYWCGEEGENVHLKTHATARGMGKKYIWIPTVPPLGTRGKKSIWRPMVPPLGTVGKNTTKFPKP